MKDYSESSVELSKQGRKLHEALLLRDYEGALKLTDFLQVEVSNIRQFCIHQIKIDETADK